MAYRKTPAEISRLEAAREHLIAAATSVVTEVGWSQASVTAVADSAGIAAGSVYQHFSSKAALAVEVFRRAAGREVEVLGTVLREPGTPVERLARGVEVFARRALENRGLAYALLAAPADPAVGAERLEYRRRYRALFAEVVHAGIEEGLLPAQNGEITAAALTGAVGEVLVDPLGAGDGATTEALLTELVAMALRCAGAPPAQQP
ncbi:TetR/AcrR family transcriptional regulator [Streptomyces sp. NPDC048567]|uniref:TetR/AcrR family transcriptional regulator n=1 Tax=unclassified Streptomyces TaxID=2593676 RepID=UPI0003811F2B|nr:MULTISPECIES: TetR/AcrR family transcriptional regulator [unclassified Streptomyces]MCX4445815.1 TetR/AcrR family transcriptional regulator [Streptomyces sp. NBC_01789]MYQ76332.1 TetR family transcriptional regulator [Streptomyces sp. SID4923]MYW11871.1 TetR family transcriptional regulator [Streptomyces sp. SID2563]NEC07802.1 TetR/AcrR family transcriptional regulator [Streptomyces sp. SID7909]OKJ04241.1 TetR family transcriptional regulator [Streptomyces sp. CB01249]